jgi:ABC-type bacteriocin/lantibiotic exporter with double-glycine peptidase domain
LDEATASLDSHTERQIQDALERVTAGRTTITIAYVKDSRFSFAISFYAAFSDNPCRHRLSTITTSDQIVVLHKGVIVERGTHNELLALQGRYHAMWEKQTTIEKREKEKLDRENESETTE